MLWVSDLNLYTEIHLLSIIFKLFFKSLLTICIKHFLPKFTYGRVHFVSASETSQISRLERAC